MRNALVFIFLVSYSLRCIAQVASPIAITTQEGLPSNAIYQSLEDQHGFLWIATDQGVARYDGKYFQIFAKEQGVPDIEVLQIAMEQNGRIWIRCYNNSIAYYHTKTNRFIDITSFAERMQIKAIKNIMALPNGGIQFDTESGSAIFNENCFQYFSKIPSLDSTFIIKQNEDGTEFRYRVFRNHLNDSSVSLYHTKGNKILSEKTLGYLGNKLIFSFDENMLYIFCRKSHDYYVLSNFKNSISSIKVSKKTLTHEYYLHNFTCNYLNILHRTKDEINGKDEIEVYVYDKKTARFLYCLKNDFIAFHMLQDRLGNQWVSTVDKGIVVYRIPSIVKPCLKSPYDKVTFYSVTKDKNGVVYAGNEKGEIVEMNTKNEQSIHKVLATNKIEWQRNIILSQNKIFTFSDGGVFVNYNREIKNKFSNTHQPSKTVCELNDSIIINGAENGLSKINTITEEITPFQTSLKEITSLAVLDDEVVYIGCTDGLHRYHIKEGSVIHMNQKDIRLKERIVSICITKDDLVWVATATNGVLVLKNNEILKQIKETDGLKSNNSLAIVRGRDNEIWLGTNKGVSRIIYKIDKSNFTTDIQNVSIIDGLNSNIVNQLFYSEGKVYVATEMGVNIIPEHVPIPSIKVRLVGVKINQKDTILLSDYELKPTEKNIILQFAGIELGGYFDHVDYSLDKGKTWTNLESTKLSIEFDHGNHTIWVRAVDVNKNASDDILKLRFDIAKPFWKTWWFWVLIALLFQLGIGYAFFRRQKKKDIEQKKLELAKAHLASLEQQAFTSLMNPHFMFNALNSIQHYINNQDRQNANKYLSDFASLIRKNFEAAQQAFIPLEQEMENLSLYLRLEKMRFNDKFNLEIEYVDDLDPEDWMMPTMILQPLIENALLHGIMPSQIHGELVIRLSLQVEDLLIEVIDNGIGVENSRALKQGSTHRSRGMELIYKRLLALSFFCKQELKLEYSVPYSDKSNPGNKISLRIPESLYQSWKKAQTMNN
ncbi:MAG TPA: histidine kinase [Chitinophagaceae bacterium]|nr:histidine kinase [Chitinophagaceae bacterium]